MEDQAKFLEMLQEIKAIASSQQNRLTKEEIKKYLSGEELSEEKLQAVYHYLGENHITVEGYEFVPDKPIPQERMAAGGKSAGKSASKGVNAAGDRSANNNKKVSAKGSRREANMKLYRREIAQFSGGLEGEDKMIVAFLQGDDSFRDTIIERYLQRVVELAGKYKRRSVPMDDIIAEGNVGLMMAIQIVWQNREEYILANGGLDSGKFFGTLDMEITHAMESYIDEMTASRDWENAVLAKTNLLHEATKYLAEEMGRLPTIEELSEYTKISREEIKSIMGLINGENDDKNSKSTS